eukprot:581793-Lingulodinium_polyedra.AAC.1
MAATASTFAATSPFQGWQRQRVQRQIRVRGREPTPEGVNLVMNYAHRADGLRQTTVGRRGRHCRRT